MPRRAYIALGLILALSGCGLPSNVVVLTPDEDGKVGRAAIHNAQGAQTLDRPFEAVGVPSDTRLGASFDADRQLVEREFRPTLAATPRTPVHYIVRFPQGAATMGPDARATVAMAAAKAKALNHPDLSVVGHTDATGAAVVNVPLSLQRANAVRDALVAEGVPSATIEVTHHGANNPLVSTRPGVAEPLNRRVEITIR